MSYFDSLKIRWLLLKRGLDRFVTRRVGLFLKPAYNAAPKDQSRRNLLKIAGLGLGAIVVGKIVGDRLFSSRNTRHRACHRVRFSEKRVSVVRGNISVNARNSCAASVFGLLVKYFVTVFI